MSDGFLAHIFVKDYTHLLQQRVILCIHKQLHQEKVPLYKIYRNCVSDMKVVD